MTGKLCNLSLRSLIYKGNTRACQIRRQRCAEPKSSYRIRLGEALHLELDSFKPSALVSSDVAEQASCLIKSFSHLRHGHYGRERKLIQGGMYVERLTV